MVKKITIRAGSLKDAAKEFIDAWHQAETQPALDAPVEKINFKDQRLLFKTLTPKRFEILEYVHASEGVSIRFLAKELDRDYSNVHQDVKILHQLGLMTKNKKDNKFHVPWDVIVTEIALPVFKGVKKLKPLSKPKSKTSRVSNG